MPTKKTTINGKTVEELYEMLKNGERMPEGTCRDYTKNPPFYECGDEEAHQALQDVTVVAFGNAVPGTPEFAAVEEDTE